MADIFEKWNDLETYPTLTEEATCDRCGLETEDLTPIVDHNSYGVEGSPSEIIHLCLGCYDKELSYDDL